MIQLCGNLIGPDAPVRILAHLKETILGVAIVFIEREPDRLVEHQKAVSRYVLYIHHAGMASNLDRNAALPCGQVGSVSDFAMLFSDHDLPVR